MKRTDGCTIAHALVKATIITLGNAIMLITTIRNQNSTNKLITFRTHKAGKSRVLNVTQVDL